MPRNAKSRPQRDEWRRLARQYTEAEIADLIGVPRGTIARWAYHFGIWPPYRCCVCGQCKPRNEFLNYKRCVSCDGKTGVFGPYRHPRREGGKPTVQEQAEEIASLTDAQAHLMMPATPGRLFYLPQRIINTDPMEQRCAKGPSPPRERVGIGGARF